MRTRAQYYTTILLGGRARIRANVYERYRTIFDRFRKALSEYRCPICGKQFRSKWGLYKHIKCVCYNVIEDIAQGIANGEPPELLERKMGVITLYN